MKLKSQRTKILKQMILDAPYEICIERPRYYTQVFKETEGEHPSIRAAKALERTLNKMTIYILDEELIVGNRSSKLVASVIPIERGEFNIVLESYIGELEKRKRQPFKISSEDKTELLNEIIPYWKGKTIHDERVKILKENNLIIMPSLSIKSFIERIRSLGIKNLFRIFKNSGFHINRILKLWKGIMENNPNLVMNVFDTQGHMVLGHTNVIKEGFKGIKERAEKRLLEIKDNEVDKKKFLESVITSCDAAKSFAERFAKLADELAEKEKSKIRKEQLLKVAEHCRYVPYNPPRSFPEAIQSLWLTQVIALIAYGIGGIFAIGRVDQYLYPFYKKDTESGKITNEEVIDLLEELLIKLSYNLLILPAVAKDTSSELGGDAQAVTIGGLSRDGEDSTNELSYLFLEAVKNIKSMTNSISMRISDKTPLNFLIKTAEVFSITSGPATFNDDLIIPAFVDCGYSLEDARDYAIIGCVELTSDGNTFGCVSGNDISLVGVLEMVLTNGAIRLIGKKTGPDTGDPKEFKSFDELMDAYKKQLAHSIELIVKYVNIKDKVYAKGFHNPYVSSTLLGCVENGLDMAQGGAKYNFSSIGGRGLGTVADSLAAIKKLVFEEKMLTMNELIDMLNYNYKGRENIRQVLLNRVPKYGNDDDFVDNIARDIAEMFCDEVSKHPTIRGGIFRPSFFSYGMHVVEGSFLGATPNGRRAGEAVSNSISPCNGAEMKGPTAVLKSCSKINHRKISNGCALNLKLLPSLLKTENDIRNLASLIKTYFELGGMHVQFNVVDNKVLRDAQKNPEKYKDLVVRVSGYSAYFVDLGKSIQDDIISRAELSNY